MRIHSRYILKELLAFFILSLLALLTIYLLVDFFAKVDNAMENHAGWQPLLLFLANQLPFVLGKFIPLSLLLGTMLSLGSLSQHNEIVAFQAGGIRLWRLTLPLLGWALLMTIATFFINDRVVPVTSLRADHLKTVVIRGDEEKNIYNLKSLWYTGKTGIYHFEELDPKHNTIGKARIYYFSAKHRLRRRLDLEGLSYDPATGKWQAARYRTRDFIHHNGFTNVSSFKQGKDLPLLIPESFSDFLVPHKEPDRMPIQELKEYISKAQNVGLPYREYTIEIYNRIFYPFSCLLMVLLAIPFSLASRRSGGTARGIAVSLGLGFSFWILLSISLALGQGGILNPLTAALLPYLLYGSGALLLLRKQLF
jgi:lipopolysaccharide export system permease protein